MLELLQVAGQVADLTTDRYRKSFIGACCRRKDGTLVSARNGLTLPSTPQKSPLAHAERKLLRKSGGYVEAVYVARVKRNGEYALAKPCPRCMAALRAMGVEMVYYTVSHTEWDGCKP